MGPLVAGPGSHTAPPGTGARAGALRCIRSTAQNPTLWKDGPPPIRMTDL